MGHLLILRWFLKTCTCPDPKKGRSEDGPLRRRLLLWQHGAIRQTTIYKAQEYGLLVASVDPRYTSKNCSRRGLRGVCRRHAFTSPHCGYAQHPDINAAFNIRNRYTVFRDSGESSITPEALSFVRDEGKPLPQRQGVIDDSRTFFLFD